jgi:hypothetical protein
MIPNTTRPMTTQIQKISMCKSKTSLLIAVTPSVIFKSSQAANMLLENKVINPERSVLLTLVVAFLNISNPSLSLKLLK